jgi:hypothetical protein
MLNAAGAAVRRGDRRSNFPHRLNSRHASRADESTQADGMLWPYELNRYELNQSALVLQRTMLSDAIDAPRAPWKNAVGALGASCE